MSLENLQFDLDDLRLTIRESGLDQEFEVEEPVALALGGTAAALTVLAYSADTDALFIDRLKDLDLPVDEMERAFLFGMVQHIRSTVDASLAGTEEQEVFRSVTSGRIRLASEQWPTPDVNLALEELKAAGVKAALIDVTTFPDDAKQSLFEYLGVVAAVIEQIEDRLAFADEPQGRAHLDALAREAIKLVRAGTSLEVAGAQAPVGAIA